MSPVHQFSFKVVRTTIMREYDINSRFTVSEFINEIKDKLLNDNQINDMGIENFELVPLYNDIQYSASLRAEDAPALQLSDDMLDTICNTDNKPTFFYIRPIPAVVPMEIDEESVIQTAINETHPPTCVICMTNLREVAFMPCGHLCICRTCNENPSVTICPICRNPLSRCLEIFNP